MVGFTKKRAEQEFLVWCRRGQGLGVPAAPVCTEALLDAPAVSPQFRKNLGSGFSKPSSSHMASSLQNPPERVGLFGKEQKARFLNVLFPHPPSSALFLSTKLAPYNLLRFDSCSRCYKFNRRVADLAGLISQHRKERDLPL